MTTLRLATRESALALWQTEHVAARLREAHPGLDVVLVPMESPTPMRTPGLLMRADQTQTPAIRAFAALLRQTSARHGRKVDSRPRAAAKTLP